jgi:hypothetical protein
MIKNPNAFETQSTSLCASVMPAAHTFVGTGLGWAIEGRTHAGSAITMAAYVPAFLKDVVPGVRAWSPPV